MMFLHHFDAFHKIVVVTKRYAKSFFIYRKNYAFFLTYFFLYTKFFIYFLVTLVTNEIKYIYLIKK